MSDFTNWIHDDITWCGNECSHIECERNLQNRLTKGGYYSAAMFKDTDMCPLHKKKEQDDGAVNGIKPCPFCGHEPEAAEVWESHGLHEGGYTWIVRCNYLNGGCGAKGGTRLTKEEAIAIWNRRIDDE